MNRKRKTGTGQGVETFAKSRRHLWTLGLFAGLRRSTTMLNGQYVLVRREVYEDSGGFAAVRAEMMDDLAYGRLLAEQGYQVPIMRGESLVSVHMYNNWRQMWHGVNRLGSGSLRYNRLMAMIPAIFVTGLMMPLWALLFNRRYVREIPDLWLIWLMAMPGFCPAASRLNRNQKTENKKRTIVLGAMMTRSQPFLCSSPQCGDWYRAYWAGAFHGRIARFSHDLL